MLTREDDIDVHALHRQGWTISAIARHLGRDRKTIRAYLNGREAGVRSRSSSQQQDPFEPYAAYVRQRLSDDPHLWASALYDELLDLGYDRSYPTMTRAIRARQLRPACEPCAPTKGRPVAVIEHPPGEETQWDWVELRDPPAHWGWGKEAHLLVGALSHSGRWRGLLCESEDQPHLIEGLHHIAAALGGLTKDWRFDRMATVVSPETKRVTATFAAVAKHYGVTVRLCPPRRGNRKGVVEKANHVAAQRFWRTVPDDISIEEAQARLDTWCTTRGDTRLRATTDGRSSVAVTAQREPLAPMPTPFPAALTVERVVSAQALVSYRGNRYSVPPHLHGTTVTVHTRLGSPHLDIATTPGPHSTPGTPGRVSPLPTVIARHLIAPSGAGATVSDDGHVTALTAAVLSAFTTEPPHRRKERRPPTPTALAEAAHLRARNNLSPTPRPNGSGAAAAVDAPVVIDLGRYAA
ncbi:MAG: IS21 family transposase, partial [Actinomycetota bacterium]|nr:IS21 family transposase [Actinomycetota bacterium]